MDLYLKELSACIGIGGIHCPCCNGGKSRGGRSARRVARSVHRTNTHTARARLRRETAAQVADETA
jgi:hypothetical protein